MIDGNKVRVVLDYLPCEDCQKISSSAQDYFCTLCHRLDRVVTTNRLTPRWEMSKGLIVPADESRIDDLKPTVIIHQPEEETEEIEEEQITEETEETRIDELLDELEIKLEEELSHTHLEQLEAQEDTEFPVEEIELLEIVKKDTKSTTGAAQINEDELPEWTPIEEEIDTPFMVGDYTLYTKVVTLRGDRKQRIYFFSKKKKKDAAAIKKPRGYKVIINKKTGLPLLKKKTFTPLGK
jgi:hypothetical protein